MKKIILIILILLNIPAWVWAFNLVTGSTHQGAVTGGSATWYYSGDGVYEGADSNVDPASYAVAGQIDATGKAITKIGFSLDSLGSVTECKVALTAVGSPTVLRSVTISSISAGWNDSDITSYSASGSIAISVCCNAAYNTDYDTSSTGYWGSSGGYSSFPGAEISLNSDSNKNRAVRIWAE